MAFGHKGVITLNYWKSTFWLDIGYLFCLQQN